MTEPLSDFLAPWYTTRLLTYARVLGAIFFFFSLGHDIIS